MDPYPKGQRDILSPDSGSHSPKSSLLDRETRGRTEEIHGTKTEINMAKVVCVVQGDNISGTVYLSQVSPCVCAHEKASPYAPTIIDASINGLPKVFIQHHGIHPS